MASVKAVVRPGRMDKNGMLKVEYVVCHKGRSMYVASGVACAEDKWVDGFVVGKESRQKNALIVKGVMRIENVLNSLVNVGLMSFEDVKAAVKKDLEECPLGRERAEGVTVRDVFEELKKGHEERERYWENMGASVDHWEEFAGDVRLQDISGKLVGEFDGWLRKRKKRVYLRTREGVVYRDGKELLSEATVGKVHGHLKAIVNAAIKSGQVRYAVHPWRDIKGQRAKVRKCDARVDDMVRLLEYEPKTARDKVVMDAFKVSFYMGGMNMCDMLAVDWRGSRIRYRRQKVRGRCDVEVVLPVLDVVREIVEKYVTKDGHLDFGYNYTRHKDMSSMMSRRVKEIAREAGVFDADRVCMYTARKSWSMYAAFVGVSEMVANYVLGHSSGGRGVMEYYQYATERDAEEALKDVESYVKYPERWEKLMRGEMRRRVEGMEDTWC